MPGASNVGIDLHDTTLTISVRNREGVEVQNLKFSTKCVSLVHEFFLDLKKPVWCAIESVGMYEWLWDLLEPMQFEVLMLADAVELRYRAGRRNAKTDRVDAGFLSLLVWREETPEGHVPDKQTREFRRLTRHWHRSSQALSSLKVRMSWICKQHNLAGPRDITGSTAQKWFLTHGEKLSPMAAFTFAQILESIEQIERQMLLLKRHLRDFSEKEAFKGDIEIVRSVPGIGIVIASIIIAETANFRRFYSAEAAGCYTGLSERTEESNGKVSPGYISRAGSPALRWALCEAINCLCRHDPHAEKIYQRLLKHTATKAEAKVAMARKLMGWLWKMVTSGQKYQPGGQGAVSPVAKKRSRKNMRASA
jgi:transposase